MHSPMSHPLPQAVGLYSAGTVAPAHTQAARFNLDALFIHHPRRWLVVLVVGYVIAASLFAGLTPAWQAPDEPAHYNYIAHLAAGQGFPVLQPGDYDQANLELLLRSHFAPDLSTDTLRYESHQPPAYYVMATPIFWLSGGRLLALRLLGVAMGVGIVVLIYLALEVVFPTKPMISLGAAAFAAFLPMHVAMTAAVNNDALAELLILASMLVLLKWMRLQFYRAGAANAGASAAANAGAERRLLLLLGILLGLGLLTKVYAYVLLVIVAATVWAVAWAQPGVAGPDRRTLPLLRLRLGHGVRQMLWVAVPALLMGLPWWLRNATLYGAWDLLGLVRHGQVVAGQPRTGDWINSYGWLAYSERTFNFTFRSFWGVFGWMGVFMDERIYTALSILTGVIFLGLLWAVVRVVSGGPDTDMDRFQVTVLALFGVILLAVTASYLWYNLEFVQHQGRYFFWGLLPISAIVALGWREVLHPLQGMITGFLAAVLASALTLTGYLAGTMDKWTVLIIGLVALLLLLQPLLQCGQNGLSCRWLPNSVQRWLAGRWMGRILHGLRFCVWATPYTLLFVLDLLIPHWFILPQLSG